jgi:uroporphyrin-3 C-methyltransferase
MIEQENNPIPKRKWRLKIILWLILIVIIVVLGLSRQFWLPIVMQPWQQHTPDKQQVVAAQPNPIHMVTGQPSVTQSPEVSNTQLPVTSEKLLPLQLQQLLQQDRRLQLQINALQVQLQIKKTHGMAWHLADASYLLGMANDQLTINNNPDMAIALLQDADQQLAMLTQAHYGVLRDEINHAITRLKNLPRVDVVSVLKQLTMLTNNIQALPCVAPALPARHQPEVQLPQHGWKKYWQQTLHALRGLVVVTQTEQPMKPLLTQDQRVNFNLHIANILQQAQWAVLHRNQQIYNLSIEQSVAALNQYFKLNQNTTAIVQQLQKLQKINIAPDYPNLHYLQNLLDDRKAPPHKVNTNLVVRS